MNDLQLGDVDLDVVFQPIVDLQTFRPFGYEVLGRALTRRGADAPARRAPRAS